MIGVDLGGTNVRAQAVWDDGSPAGERVQNPSFAQQGTARILEAMISTVREAIDSAEGHVTAVGVAIPGHIDDAAGTTKWSPNLGEEINGVFHAWRNVQLKAPLAEALGLKIITGNDANCAALGEYMFGSGGNKAHCLCLLTLGTGIGGGVVLGPQSVMGHASGPLLLLGGNKGGGELGHTMIQRGGLDCAAGSYGAMEAYCNRDSIINRAIHRYARRVESLMWEKVGGDLSQITPKIIAESADEGDFEAQEVLREVGENLGAGIGSMINIFAPDVFAIGGQVVKAGKWLLEPAVREAAKVAIPTLFCDCRIVPAECGDDAGLLGAAAMAYKLGD